MSPSRSNTGEVAHVDGGDGTGPVNIGAATAVDGADAATTTDEGVVAADGGALLPPPPPLQPSPPVGMCGVDAAGVDGAYGTLREGLVTAATAEAATAAAAAAAADMTAADVAPPSPFPCAPSTARRGAEATAAATGLAPRPPAGVGDGASG